MKKLGLLLFALLFAFGCSTVKQEGTAEVSFRGDKIYNIGASDEMVINRRGNFKYAKPNVYKKWLEANGITGFEEPTITSYLHSQGAGTLVLENNAVFFLETETGNTGAVNLLVDRSQLSKGDIVTFVSDNFPMQSGNFTIDGNFTTFFRIGATLAMTLDLRSTISSQNAGNGGLKFIYDGSNTLILIGSYGDFNNF